MSLRLRETTNVCRVLLLPCVERSFGLQRRIPHSSCVFLEFHSSVSSLSLLRGRVPSSFLCRDPVFVSVISVKLVFFLWFLSIRRCVSLLGLSSSSRDYILMTICLLLAPFISPSPSLSSFSSFVPFINCWSPSQAWTDSFLATLDHWGGGDIREEQISCTREEEYMSESNWRKKEVKLVAVACCSIL
jgi:hypothetical protein